MKAASHGEAASCACSPDQPTIFALHSRNVLLPARTSSDSYSACSSDSEPSPPEEAIILISSDLGTITDIIRHPQYGKESTTSRALILPEELVTKCLYIDLKSALIMPGVIDVYSGMCLESSKFSQPCRPSDSNISLQQPNTSTLENQYSNDRMYMCRAITSLTRRAAVSGITTLVECPTATLSQPACTKDSLSRRWHLLNDDALMPKHVDYGILAAVDPMHLDEIRPMAETGYALGLFGITGIPTGPVGTCPQPIEALKVPRIVRAAADGGMRGSLFIKAETYTAKQLRLASPLRSTSICERRRPELKIDHPAYMLGVGADEISLSESAGSDLFDFDPHENVSRPETKISRDEIGGDHNEGEGHISQEAGNVRVRSSSSSSSYPSQSKSDLTTSFRLSVTPTQNSLTYYNGRVSPRVRGVRSPTVKSLGRRNHSFHFDNENVKRHERKKGNAPLLRPQASNHAFLSALLSEELKSYDQAVSPSSVRKPSVSSLSDDSPTDINSESSNKITRGAEENQSNYEHASICDVPEDHASFELLVQLESDRTTAEAQCRSSAFSSNNTIGKNSLVSRTASEPVAIRKMTSKFSSSTHQRTHYDEIAMQRAHLWGELVPPGPDEFPISPPKLANLSKQPSILARRQAAAAAAAAASVVPATTGKPTSHKGSIHGTSDENLEVGTTRSKASTRKNKLKPFLNLQPLSLYKVPDTLTTSAICANYTIYLSQRGENAELDAVRNVLEGMPPEQLQNRERLKVPVRGSIPVHFCGISSALAVSAVEAWRRAGRKDISCGTAPHYLVTSADMFSSGCTLAKCSPPIRDIENQRMLRESVVTSAVDMISSWHLEFEKRQKMMHTGDLIRAVGGIDSIETLVPACWTFCKQAGLGPEFLGVLLSSKPARRLGLDGMKGKIQIGAAADLCIVDL